jgi:hypothetical protein
MATDPILAELNLTTLQEIYPKVIEDQFFLDTPLEAYIRDHCLVPFGGGAFMQNTFLYAPMVGGSYAKGDSWNVTKRQTLAGTVFDMRKYYVAVPEYLEDLEVENKGPQAVFSLVDIDLRNAMQTISAISAVDMSLHGQASSAGVIIGNRPKAMNGWIEALNDGVVPGWEGSKFTSYGTQARNGVIGTVMNSTPYFCGDTSGNTGPITYNVLEETYQTCSIGREEPNLGVTNKAAYAYIKERIQPQQRFTQEKDPYFGVTGFRFNSAMILKDDYFPSLKYGKNDADLGNYLTSTFTSPASADSSSYVTTASNMPASTTINVGEVFCWFNTKKILYRVSNSREFGFGFSGFIPAQDNSKVVGTVKAAQNMEFTSCRLHKQIFGIGS